MKLEFLEAVLDTLSFPLVTPDLLGKDRLTRLHSRFDTMTTRMLVSLLKFKPWVPRQPSADKSPVIYRIWMTLSILLLILMPSFPILGGLYNSGVLFRYMSAHTLDTLSIIGWSAFFCLAGIFVTVGVVVVSLSIFMLLLVVLMRVLLILLEYNFNGTLLLVGAAMFFVARTIAIYQSWR